MRFECQFTLVENDNPCVITPEDKRSVGDALVVLHETVQTVHASHEGVLAVEFENGMTIRAEPDPRYESWSLGAPGGIHIICLPGGGLAEWCGEHGMPTLPGSAEEAEGES